MKKKIIFIYFIFLFLCTGTPLFCMEEIIISGFISQGYMKTTGNDYLPGSMDGTFEINEMGINFATMVTPKLRIGTQFFARDFGEFGNDKIELDYAYAEYNYQRWLKVRGGRFKVSTGLYNQTRDIDSSRTFILLPSLYMESFREIFISMKGIGISGLLPFGLSYTASCGVIDNSSSFKDSFLFASLFPLVLKSNLADFFGEEDFEEISRVKTESVHWKRSVNLGIVWDTPLDGFRCSVNYYTGRSEALMSFEYKGLPLNVDIDFEEVAARTFSVEYTSGDTIVAAEYQLAPFYIKYQPRYKQESYYASIIHRFSDLLEMGIYYSEFYPHYDDRDGSELRQGLTKLYYWYNDFCYSVRFDLNDNFIIKFEGHALYGVFGNPEAYKLEVDDRSSIKEHWGMYLVKLSYNF